MTEKNTQTAPKHLSKEAKEIFNGLAADYSIDDIAGLRILRVACEAFDRAQACRNTIDRDGLTVLDKFGQVKPHPLLSTERDNRAAFLAGLKALNLDLEPVKGIGRPPGRK